MSLKAIHLAFIFLSTLLAAGFSAWCFREMSRTGDSALGLAGGMASACAVALAAYGIRFIRKTKGLGYL